MAEFSTEVGRLAEFSVGAECLDCRFHAGKEITFDL